jgi:hypothetical protein
MRAIFWIPFSAFSDHFLQAQLTATQLMLDEARRRLAEVLMHKVHGEEMPFAFSGSEIVFSRSHPSSILRWHSR